MKNFKQIAFGMLVCAMAIGFSSFTNAKKVFGHQTTFTVRYNNITGVNDGISSHYVYEDESLQNCDQSTKECSAKWTTTNAPSLGAAPSGSPSYAGDALPGTYDPN